MGAIADDAAMVMTAAQRHRGNQGDVPVADLLRWLSSVHIAQLEAGELYDYDGWNFFLTWYDELS